jgi:hypothetical protein
MPILGTPFAVRMDALNEAQAQRNHGQSLARLAERGGLSLQEAHAVAERRAWRNERAEDAAEALHKLGPVPVTGAMVQRFLQWPVPSHMQPSRTASDLMDATAVRDMLTHVLGTRSNPIPTGDTP